MHPETRTISKRIRSLPNDSRLAALENAYRGASGVVVTCGPSLGNYEPSKLREALRGQVVFAVKQAIDPVGDQADFLCFNSFNVSRYSVESPDTLRVYASEPSGMLPQLNRADLRLPHSGHSGNLKESLASVQDFDDHLLSDTAVRPWGPGILHEVVFYLAVHLGLSRLTTVGWDIANARGNNVHFYDAPGGDNFFDRGRANAYSFVSARRHLPKSVKRGLRWSRTVTTHIRGGVYNKATMIEGESDVVAAATVATSEWLAAHGVQLTVAGDSPFIAQEVTQISQAEFLSRSN